MVLLAGGEELHEIVLGDGAVENLEVGDDAAEGIEDGIEDESLQGSLGVSLGSRNAVYDGIEDFVDALACLAAGADDVVAVAAEQVHDLVLHLVGLGTLQVALVDDGDNLQVVVDGHVEVGNGLCLDALAGVDDEQCALAGGDGAGNLVGEVDVSRSVDEVESI